MSLCKRALIGFYKDKLLDIYSAALRSVSPASIIPNRINIDKDILTITCPENKAKIHKTNLKTNNVHIITFGKSAISLANAVGNLVINSSSTKSFQDGFIIAPHHLENYTLEESIRLLNIRCRFGAKNNLPDEKSVSATKELLDFVKLIVKQDQLRGQGSTFLILFGGGGSACLTYPKFIDLNKKLELIRFLQQKGADIVELNKVRRYFSHVKGGQLGRFIQDQGDDVEVISLIISDVVGSSLEFIASGPTVMHDNYCEESLKNDMIDVLEKYSYKPIKDLISHHEISKTGQRSRITNLIIGDNKVAIQAAKQRAEELGFETHIMSDCLEGYTDDIVDEIMNFHLHIMSNSEKSRPVIIIAGGEATVKADLGGNWGIGGRCQQMALDYFIAKNQVDQMFLAATTDGQDGPTDVAACLVTCEDNDDMSKIRPLATEAKRLRDSHTFWSKYKQNSLIKLGLTGTNVMDLYMHLTYVK